jgi:hypothetical protein
LDKSKAKYKAQNDKDQVDHQFQFIDQVLLHINKDRMKGEGENIRPILYGPFNILENIGTNVFHLHLPSYMQMYSVVNFDNLKLYEPPLIMDEDESIQVPKFYYFSSKYLDELHENVILDRRIRNSQRGDVEYLRVVIKEIKPSQEKWIEVGRVRDIYPHLFVD